MTNKTPQGDDLAKDAPENDFDQQVKTKTPDTPEQGAEQVISKDDFVQENDTSNEEKAKAKDRASARKEMEEKNIEFALNKFVETDEDGEMSFEKVPNHLKWTVDKIKQRFLPEEAPIPQTHDIDSLVNKRLDEREFWAKLDWLLSDESLDSTQKADIRDKFKELKAQWVKSDMYAINEAEKFVKSQSKQVKWTMPNLGRPVDLSKNVYTNEELSNMSQEDYDQVMNQVENGKIQITK